MTATAGASNDVDAFRPKRLGCGIPIPIPIPIPSRPAAEVSSHQPGQRAIRREIDFFRRRGCGHAGVPASLTRSVWESTA